MSEGSGGAAQSWGAQICTKEWSRVQQRGAKASTWSRNASGEEGNNLEELGKD